ncbi:MAG: hypothetical protein K0S33_1791 [Bacteroidetes bacterium]|jgi:hypothetical protein|nr:hypothetical protein [Bacteroidota bacterium]
MLPDFVSIGKKRSGIDVYANAIPVYAPVLFTDVDSIECTGVQL